MNNEYIEVVDRFAFSLEDTPDNIEKFINNPNVLLKKIECVDTFSIFQDMIYRSLGKTGSYSNRVFGIHRQYSQNMQKVRFTNVYIKHRYYKGAPITAISNPFYTMTYNDVLKLIEGTL